MKDLKECPFCGKIEPVRIVSAEENAEITVIRWFKAICCDGNSGGCGATSGYRENDKEAIVSWNKRVKQ